MNKEATKKLPLNASFEKMQDSNLVVWSHDENSYTLNFEFSKNECPFNLELSNPRILLLFQPNNEEYIYPLEIVSEFQGLAKFTIPDDILGFSGYVHAHIYIDYQSRKHDFGHFKFKMNQSAIDGSFSGLSEIYVSEFDEAVKKMDETILELDEKQTNALEKNKEDFDNWFESIRGELEGADPGGKILKEIMKARGEYSDLNARLDETSSFQIEAEFDLAGDIRPVFADAVKEFHTAIASNTFNLLLFSDAHTEEKQRLQFYPLSYLSMSHLNNALFMHDKVDAMILNGDNYQSDSYSLANVRKQAENFSTKVFDTEVQCDIFFNLGNHDDGSGRSAARLLGPTLKPSEILGTDDFKSLFKTKEQLNGETRFEGDSLYSFKDYPEKNIRLITLNSSDIPENITKDNGTIKYLRWNVLGYREDQLNWLANTALKNIPEGLDVMIVAHSPIQEGWSLAKNINHDLLKGILTAFKGGLEYAGSSEVEDFEATVMTDYVAQGPRNIIGFFSGHLHNERNYTFSGINNITCLNSIADKAHRVGNTLSEDAFSVIQVNTVTKEIKIKGFGAATDREYTY